MGKKRHIDNIEIYLNGCIVQRQPHIKFLGTCTIDDKKLDW